MKRNPLDTKMMRIVPIVTSVTLARKMSRGRTAREYSWESRKAG